MENTVDEKLAHSVTRWKELIELAEYGNLHYSASADEFGSAEDLAKYDDVEEAGYVELFEDTLSVQFVVDESLRLVNFEFTVTLGGPTIWLDKCGVYGSWGHSSHQEYFHDAENLFQYAEECWVTRRDAVGHCR